jgi:TPR repeat protein
MYNIGHYYYKIEKNYPKAIEYFLMSIEKGDSMML